MFKKSNFHVVIQQVINEKANYSKEWNVRFMWGTDTRIETTTESFPIEDILSWCKNEFTQ